MGAAYHLEQLYENIRVTRMVGVPILNDKIKVQAVGFREWNQYVLGALITPWFMNLMLLPTESTNWDEHKFGSKHKFTFEAGAFEFTLGAEEDLGKYMSCSMFSPMFDFADHDAAVQTAEAIVTGMFKEENKEELVGESMSPSDDLVVADDDETSLTETMLEGVQTIGSIAKENLEKPLSRRELLRGGLFRKKVKSDKGEESD